MNPEIKAKLGQRYTCFQCATKFYDMNRDPFCPECQADQREAPVPDMKALLHSGKKRSKADMDDDDIDLDTGDDDDDDLDGDDDDDIDLDVDDEDEDEIDEMDEEDED